MSAIDPSFDLGKDPDSAQAPGRHELAMLAHDIRGALSGIIGGMGEIEASDLSPGLREQVERVATAARSLASLTAMMLGEMPGSNGWAGREQVRLHDFLRYIRSRWAGEAHEKGLGFDIVPATNLPSALSLGHLGLARAIGNMISNAIKHSDRGTVRLYVERGAGGGAAFRVADDGPGLPDEVLRRVRDDEPPLGGAGHGLGLYIVRQIAEQHGAAFAIENREPHGAEVSLTFPAGVCSEPEPARSSTPATERINLEGLRVLLAEDNPTNQMVAMQMLRSLNADVVVCGDGVEALDQFERGAFDVVVVDIEMPRLSGLDVIRAIRARDDERAGVPMVALTAYALREHRDRVLEAGANGLISKPITSIEAFGRDLMAHVAGPPPGAPGTQGAEAQIGNPAAVVDAAIYGALVEAIGPEMMGELLDKVVADLFSARGVLSGALLTLDRSPIRSASHILISVAGAIGATRLQACARSLNIAASAALDDRLAEQVPRCIDEIDAAAAFARDQRVTG